MAVRAGTAAPLDYTADSLEAVDRLPEDFHTRGAPLPPGLHVDVSAYVFEVARRESGGRYLRGDDENLFVLVIGEPDFRLGVMVMGKVTGRVTNGREDSIPFFYAGIAPLVARRGSATLT